MELLRFNDVRGCFFRAAVHGSLFVAGLVAWVVVLGLRNYEVHSLVEFGFSVGSDFNVQSKPIVFGLTLGLLILFVEYWLLGSVKMARILGVGLVMFVFGVFSSVLWFFNGAWFARYVESALALFLGLSLEFGLLFLSGFVGCRVVFGRGSGFVGILSGSAIAFAWMAICVSVIVVAMNFADSKGVFSGMCFCGFGL